MFVLWVVTPCRLVGGTNASEKDIISIFRAEVFVCTYKIMRRYNPDDQQRQTDHNDIFAVVYIFLAK
jgi:hypothetical protein